MKGLIRSLILSCVALTLLAAPAAAQERGTIQAIATVVSSLRVIGMNNLNFGTVTPGIDKSVDKTDVGFAGEWQITGSVGAELSVDFELPTNLYTGDSLGVMMITFNASDASYDDGTGGGQIAPLATLNPNGPSVFNIGAAGTVAVWIGGMVMPNISQTGGDYAADIVLVVAYTGS
jgi:hypothetical protein